MASIASRVPKLRPTLLVAALLATTLFALRDSQHRHDCGHAAVASLDGRAPLTLDWSAPLVDSWDVPALPDGVIQPGPHPDARPWPQGMVIGTPAIDRAIVQWDHALLDSVVSALIAGLLVLES
jgi:hypothetical protein